jgi:hypothetical protein
VDDVLPPADGACGMTCRDGRAMMTLLWASLGFMLAGHVYQHIALL